jgi:cytoskeletal protein RodZ
MSTEKRAAKSVFTDDSGSRKRLVTWTIRTASCVLAAGAVAVGLSVFGQVTLPGLDSPVHIPGIGAEPSTPRSQSPQAVTGDAASTDSTADGADAAVTTSVNGAKGTGSTHSDGTNAKPAPTTPAPVTPVAKHTGKPTAKPTTAASPTHTRGSGPTEPPGQSKKITPTG